MEEAVELRNNLENTLQPVLFQCGQLWVFGNNLHRVSCVTASFVFWESPLEAEWASLAVQASLLAEIFPSA